MTNIRFVAASLLFGAASAGTYSNAADAAENACVQGPWKVLSVSAPHPLRYETEHFAFHWIDDAVSMSAAQTAGGMLEDIWDSHLGKAKFPVPYCDTSTKYKVHVEVDPAYGNWGGPINQRDMGMWIPPGTLRSKATVAHELTHSLQGASQGFRNSPYVGWIWESHANWMASQLDSLVSDIGCSELLVNSPHIYWGSTRNRYCNWQFFEHLKNRHGYSVVQRMWTSSLRPTDSAVATEDPMRALMRVTGWSVSQLNDEFGHWAMRNVNWDYTNPDGTDRGSYFRSAYGGYGSRSGERRYRVTQLDVLDAANRRYNVPFYWAPQRFGYNLVKLVVDSGATSVTVDFRGAVQNSAGVSSFPGMRNEPPAILSPNSDWRWGLVAVSSSGTSRYSALQSGSSASVTFPVASSDSLYLVVVGTPSANHQIRWDQPYYSIYRYPWAIQLRNAYPEGYEPNAQPLFSNVARHSNGGGWVHSSASVSSSAYVGPNAYVLRGTVSDNARVEDHAIVDNAQMSGNSRIGGLTRLTGGTVMSGNSDVETIFKGIGAFETGITISGTAMLRGDVEQRGVSMSSGCYYGFVGADATSDSAQGASLSEPVPEITRKPDYSLLSWPAPVPTPLPTPVPTPVPTPPPTLPPTPPPTPTTAPLVPNGLYKIVSAMSGKVLDVAGSSTERNGNVVQNSWKRWANSQKWTVEVVSGDYYRILNYNSGLALDVEGASKQDGANVLQWPWKATKNENQLWSFSASGSHYGIINKNSGKALDVWEWNPADGANIAQFSYWGGSVQLWTLSRIS